MSSNDKVKGKHSKDHKGTHKPGNPAQTTTSTSVKAEDLCFLYTIDVLKPKYDEKYPQRFLMINGKTGNDVAHFWFPPNRAKMFERENGNVYRWRPEETRLLKDFPRPEKKVEVASVFFQARQDNFLAVFRDCAKYNISEGDLGWSQIGFHHNPGFVSEVDIAGQFDLLAAPATGSSWMPQVIPEVYDYDRNMAARFDGESGGLCGKLSLLIAMAAFSAEERNAENVVATCFRGGMWKKHQFSPGIGRYHNRGVVVSIYLDPAAKDVTMAHLKAFEKGAYGPIFEYKPTPATQPSTFYTHLPNTTSAIYGAPSQVATPRSGFTYQMPTVASGYTAPAGYTAPGGYAGPTGYVAPSGYAASSGNSAPSGYAATSMIQESANLYEENDDDEQEENQD